MSILDYISPGLWKIDGKCSDLSIQKDDESRAMLDMFFSEDDQERSQAAKLCQGCPVRLRCLKDSMESGEIHGVWGGVDESERRRDLWVSPTGKVGMRKTRPRCPDCLGDLSLFDNKATCNVCGFSWRSDTTAEGLRTILKPKK